MKYFIYNLVTKLLNKPGKTVFNFIKNASKSAGLPPGTVIYTGRQREEPVTIELIDYDADQVREQTVAQVKDCLQFKSASSVIWINIVCLTSCSSKVR